MDTLVLILFLGVLAESVTEYFMVFTEEWSTHRRKCIIQMIVLVGSIAIAFLCNLGALAKLGHPLPRMWVDYLITGFVISRGANFANDIFSKLSAPTSTSS